MENGNHTNYKRLLCDERHRKISEEFSAVWARISTLEGRLWTIIILLVLNLGGVIITYILK